MGYNKIKDKSHKNDAREGDKWVKEKAIWLDYCMGACLNDWMNISNCNVC